MEYKPIALFFSSAVLINGGSAVLIVGARSPDNYICASKFLSPIF
jgi:hypothetical protein